MPPKKKKKATFPEKKVLEKKVREEKERLMGREEEVKLPTDTRSMEILQLLRIWTEADTKKLIIKETTPKDFKSGKKRRQPSETVLEGIRSIAGDEINCKKSEQKCFPELISWGFTDSKEDARVALEAIPLISELYREALFLQGTGNTQKQAFTDVKKPFDRIFRDYPNVLQAASEYLKTNPVLKRLLQANYEKQVYEKNIAQKEITDTFVLAKINELKNSTDWRKLMIAVGLAVGSRSIEILRRSMYTTATNPKYITVVGVAKEHNQNIGDRALIESKADWQQFVTDDYNIKLPNVDSKNGEEVIQRKLTKPVVGMLAVDVIDLIAKIRQMVSEDKNIYLGYDPLGNNTKGKMRKTNVEITNLCNASLNEAMKQYFVDGYTYHYTRAIYAEMAWVAFAPPNMSKTAFFSQVLGHKEQSLTTALSYQKFAVRRKLQEDDPDLIAKITELQEEFNVFKKRIIQKPGFQDIPIPSAVVYLYDQNKEVVEISKVPWTGKESRAEQLKKTVESLKEKKILPSYNNLRKLGFGTNLIFRWRDKLAISEIEEMWKAKKEEDKVKEDYELTKLKIERKEKEREEREAAKEEKRKKKLEERERKKEEKNRIKELEKEAKRKEKEWLKYLKVLKKAKLESGGRFVNETTTENEKGKIVQG